MHVIEHLTPYLIYLYYRWRTAHNILQQIDHVRCVIGPIIYNQTDLSGLCVTQISVRRMFCDSIFITPLE